MSVSAGLLTYLGLMRLLAPWGNDIVHHAFGVRLTAAGTVQDFHLIPF